MRLETVASMCSSPSSAIDSMPNSEVGGIVTTPVYDSYWHFAAERQHILMRRLQDAEPPWTDDAVLRRYRFTNAYRATDRASQYLIKHVIYNEDWSAEDTVFRVLLFKTFNRIDTWESLEQRFGPIVRESFDPGSFGHHLSNLMRDGHAIYSPAYVMPSASGVAGSKHKHRNHLSLLDKFMEDALPLRLQDCQSLQDVYELLRGYPSIGRFLAFQYAIDLNYSTVIDFSEMSFVVAGPGASGGISKCFSDTGGLSDEEIIRWVTERQDAEFERLRLNFNRLGNRPLQLIDCQNLFCEVDKYARVVHPAYVGRSGRTKIKRRFSPTSGLEPLWFPPKWGVSSPLCATEVAQR